MSKSCAGQAWIIGLIAVIIAHSACSRPQSPEVEWTNLSHVNSLYEEIEIDDRPMAIVHIYSEYPEYGWVGDSDEGIACVDDAARAAVLYLRHFEFTGDSLSLHRGRRLIEFCRFMQAEDGQFYNFIFADHRINRLGKTSFKSLGWWAGRAIWALGEGFRIYVDRDSIYAGQLQSNIQALFPHIDSLLANNTQVDRIDGFALPRWLLYNSAADATTELMLGLASYAEASGDDRAIRYLERFSDGIIRMQLGDAEHLPFGAFLSWRNVWHAWGNSQTMALARVAAITKNQEALQAAEKEVQHFYPFWLASGWPREIEFAWNDTLQATRIDTFPQIAYGLRPMILGALRLYEATGDERFAELAGELGTWFLGNNPAQQRMYDPSSGRCFDGILSPTEINRNAGAESTIEAVLSVLEIEQNPISRQRFRAYLEAGVSPR